MSDVSIVYLDQMPSFCPHCGAGIDTHGYAAFDDGAVVKCVECHTQMSSVRKLHSEIDEWLCSYCSDDVANFF